MKKSIYHYLKYILNLILGRSQFQFLFDGLHLFALQGKNIGIIGKPQESGEINAFKQFLKNTPTDRELIVSDWDLMSVISPQLF